MKKIEGQMSFDISSEEERLKDERPKEEVEKQLKKNSDEREKKKTEDRIKVESVEKVTDELTGELCYRIVLFWEVIQRPLSFVYYPKDNKVRWTSRPDIYISKEWWKKLIGRVKAVGSDYYKRYNELIKKKDIEN